MNLTDKEILELNELCSAVVDQRLTDGQRERLAGWLASSEDARAYYVRAMGLSASLHSYAAETHAEAPAPRSRFFFSPLRWWAHERAWWIAGGVAAAAAFVVLFSTMHFESKGNGRQADALPRVNVARLTATKDALWKGESIEPGSPLTKGQNLELTGGYAEVTFDSGARIQLEGPAVMTVNSAWDSTLLQGTLKALVPSQAIGFRVLNRSVEVVDLGTEFTMIAGNDGSAEVFVLKGEVEAAARSPMADQDFLLIRENQSRRFAQDGVSDVPDSEQKFARFAQSFALERFPSSYRQAQWSFDDAATLNGAYLGANTGMLVANLKGRTGEASPSAEGRWNNALSLDGQHYLQTSFPGLSGATPHTVAFWVRVAANASLADAYSILGWRSSLSKLSHRPVHVSWNRNPSEGALGAIRTDFAGGCAIGTTSLRDGRWHHIAVVFVPGEDDRPVEVKQYVDGHLESSTIIPGRTRGPASSPDASLDDILWIGSRVGSTGPRQERFRGEIDELFIADGKLEPLEIVRLKQENRLTESPTAIAAR